MGKLLMEQVTKESLEQAKGSIVEMTVVPDKLQDIYTKWFDKTKRKHRKAVALAAQWKQDEVSMQRSMVEICSKLPDM